MVFANVEWTAALCTILALACVIQLLITGVLSFGIPHFLVFSKTQLCTAVGLIAGCVTVPTVIRIKTSKISPNMDRIYGYTILYQRLAIAVCFSLHLTSTILVIYTLIKLTNFNENFMNLMKEYNTKVLSKALTDNIQWSLQCCGVSSYKQWFEFDWIGQYKKQKTRETCNYEEYDDKSNSYSDLVPFSCCKRKTLGACVHEHLSDGGTDSININGCSTKIYYITLYLLILEFISYFSCVIIEVIIISLLVRKNENERESQEKIKTAENVQVKGWSQFSNSGSEVPIIEPSSQTVLNIRAVQSMP